MKITRIVQIMDVVQDGNLSTGLIGLTSYTNLEMLAIAMGAARPLCVFV